MIALLIFGIISLILTVSFGVTITVLVSKALSDAFRTINAMSKRNGEQIDKLLDRLVAIDWEKYATLRSLEDAEEGAFIPPSDGQEEGGLEKPRRFPRLAALRERTELTPDEERLIAEDFE
jgi:hypothetical protein